MFPTANYGCVGTGPAVSQPGTEPCSQQGLSKSQWNEMTEEISELMSLSACSSGFLTFGQGSLHRGGYDD